MSLSYRYRAIFLTLAALLIASLACYFPGSNPESPADTEPIPVTTESVDQLEENLQSAAATAQSGGPVTAVIDEAQLTSLVAFELQDQKDPEIKDVQVFLRDGQIELHGNVNQSGLSLPLVVVAEVSVNAQGQPETELVSANVGPLPMPQSVLDRFSAQLDAGLANYISSSENQMVIEDIQIGNGQMTITGHTRQ
jgi:uncharacterized protein YpmS